jgi:hypothetical protein
VFLDDAAQHLLHGGPGPESFSVGKVRRDRPGKREDKNPGRNDLKSHARLRSWTQSRRVLRTAADTSSTARMPDRTRQLPSAKSRSRKALPSFLFAAGFAAPSRGPSQPQRVDDIKICCRQRLRLLHSMASSGRPNRAPIDVDDSRRMQWRNKASMMTVPAYQRRGCSQSGNRLIVWPHARQRNRRIQITIQPVSISPQTCREYMPWPTSRRIPSEFRAACPQTTQWLGRRSSREGASVLLAQSCSTVTARPCRMINSFGKAMVRAQSRKDRPDHRLFSFPKIDHPNQMSRKSTSVLCCMCQMQRHTAGL